MEGTLLEERSLTVGKEPFLQSHVSVRRKQPVSARRRPAVARIIEDEMEGQWCFQKPVKHLIWSVLRKYLKAKSRSEYRVLNNLYNQMSLKVTSKLRFLGRAHQNIGRIVNIQKMLNLIYMQ